MGPCECMGRRGSFNADIVARCTREGELTCPTCQMVLCEPCSIHCHHHHDDLGDKEESVMILHEPVPELVPV